MAIGIWSGEVRRGITGRGTATRGVTRGVVASYADALWARHAIPKEGLRRRLGVLRRCEK